MSISRFLDLVAYSEGTYGIGDNGYDLLVGSTKARPLVFDSYDTHPNVYNKQFNSTAAGRYQIIHETWVELGILLKVSDFTPDTQDLMATKLIERKTALLDIASGNIISAITKCSGVWASFPGNEYDQHHQRMTDLLNFYNSPPASPPGRMEGGSQPEGG